ncbi:MAG TPA: universal stress protein [Solirubrobacteraceae bacterium]|nr:universal stress protein [Solirubrobacteraceae bacterium]
MSTKIIVSYDGTHNENDAIALGRLLAQGGAEVSLAYVRHAPEPESDREALAQREAQELLERGAALFGGGEVGRHVVTNPSTPGGLSALAEQVGANVIVFCSDSHTAAGRIAVGNSAQRLLEGGQVAVAIAPAGFAQSADANVRVVALVGGGDDPAARSTAESLASALGADVASRADGADLLVIGSRPEAEQGHVSISSASEHLIDESASPVLVVPRGGALSFVRQPALAV